MNQQDKPEIEARSLITCSPLEQTTMQRPPPLPPQNTTVYEAVMQAEPKIHKFKNIHRFTCTAYILYSLLRNLKKFWPRFCM